MIAHTTRWYRVYDGSAAKLCIVARCVVNDIIYGNREATKASDIMRHEESAEEITFNRQGVSLDKRAPTRISRASEIAAQIESDILKAGASSGAHMGLRKELLDRFGASPSVINEALRILRERGLITVKPGPYGGVFVSEDVQWIQLGGINMWFRKSALDPLELFRSRMHLEDLLARVAVERATPDDIRSLHWALDSLRTARGSAQDYWSANLRLHTEIAHASKLTFLDETYQALLICLSQRMMHAEFVGDHEPLLEKNIAVHAELVRAIQTKDPDLLDEVLARHRDDMVRIGDPSWSPDVANAKTKPVKKSRRSH